MNTLHGCERSPQRTENGVGLGTRLLCVDIQVGGREGGEGREVGDRSRIRSSVTRNACQLAST